MKAKASAAACRASGPGSGDPGATTSLSGNGVKWFPEDVIHVCIPRVKALADLHSINNGSEQTGSRQSIYHARRMEASMCSHNTAGMLLFATSGRLSHSKISKIAGHVHCIVWRPLRPAHPIFSLAYMSSPLIVAA